ncbi:uncharacterized protein LOC122860013 [Aphidius gifuensis]|uniref:uncharacterized protein LOC122860013 n=1 Tax=Aphidius gifuensis TaxID=684658 RepID=UPI001CDCE6EA|nr:uncharacterized protein LOC122860013 [Aphidius gifuensis]
MGGRLFQQWVVDSYVKVEKDRMNFCRMNQKKIRADSYQGLIDHLQQRATETDRQVGKMIILPPTFTGSPRNMLQHYQDAMAVVRKFGKPDLFITMTCNPNWREIKENLLLGQTPSDRPDLVSRVFDIKKDEFVKKIVKENIFGEILAYVFVIEYQKRGLPHGHFLFTLKQQSKITTPDIVNKYISAEIPDINVNPRLHNIVMKNMIHGLCGDWCKDDTGHDAAFIVVTDTTNSTDKPIDHDEIKNHIETRYVSPVEACDRIFGRPLQHKSHSISRLPVHLPNQQSVIIDDEAGKESIRASMDKQTMLMEYFALNQRDLSARTFTYTEISGHYVFNKQSGLNQSSWKPRKRQFNIIGRMYFISPSQVELFHLRLLLITVKRATSFENLRTVDGMTHDTYRSACLALGLIEDDAEWDRAMTEEKKLWEDHKDGMSEDFKRTYSLNQSYARSYHEINTHLSRERSALSKFPTMPLLTDFEPVDNLNDEEIIPLQRHEEIGSAQYAKLNTKQKVIVDKILNAVLSDQRTSNSCFFIDGPGGSGKTFVYSTIYHLLKSKRKKISTTAFTGIAAISLPEGRTMHNVFGMLVPMYADSISSIKCQSKEAEKLVNTDVLICDEAPMAPRYCMELADRTYRDVTKVDLSFGGRIVLMGGDFRQLLPVLKNELRKKARSAFKKDLRKSFINAIYGKTLESVRTRKLITLVQKYGGKGGARSFDY